MPVSYTMRIQSAPAIYEQRYEINYHTSTVTPYLFCLNFTTILSVIKINDVRNIDISFKIILMRRNNPQILIFSIFGIAFLSYGNP